METTAILESLATAWIAVKKDAGIESGFYRRKLVVPGAHSVYVGILRPEGTRQISFEIPDPPKGTILRERTRGYSVDTEPSESGKPNCIFVQVSETSVPMSADLFGMLCADLIAAFSAQSSLDEASRALIRRLQHGKLFFQHRSDGGLTREEAIGLFAEIEFLAHLVASGIPPESAVASWAGPVGANQDFLFGTAAVEVKATAANDPGIVRISNLRQLDPTGLSHLFLRCDSYDFRQGAGRTLPESISALTVALGTCPTAAANFQDRLIAAGYVEPLPGFVMSWGFTRRGIRHFRVTDGFPRLLESAIPTGILDVQFALSLAACSAFEVAEKAVNDTIRPLQ